MTEKDAKRILALYREHSSMGAVKEVQDFLALPQVLQNELLAFRIIHLTAAVEIVRQQNAPEIIDLTNAPSSATPQ